MKRILSLVLALAMLLGAGAGAHAEPDKPASPLGDLLKGLIKSINPGDATPEPGEVTDAPGAPDATPAPPPFEDSVAAFTTYANYGVEVNCARLDDWTVTYGYLNDKYCLIGQLGGGAPQALTSNDTAYLVPVGDSIVYYGEISKGEYSWLIRNLNDPTPLKLPIKASDHVFYSDPEYLWYYSEMKNGSMTVSRMSHEGKNKKQMGKVSGHVVTMMPDERVLVINFDKNIVQLWHEGKSTTIYKPDTPMSMIVTSGRELWIEHDGYFGLLENGALDFTFEGHILGAWGTSDQTAMLISHPDSDEYDVLLLNDIEGAYAYVGTVPAAENIVMELRLPAQLVAWSPAESRKFDLPPASAWMPYGYYDQELMANGLSDEAWPALLQGSWSTDPEAYEEGVRLVFNGDDMYRLPVGGGKVSPAPFEVFGGKLYVYSGNPDERTRRFLSGPFGMGDSEGDSPYVITIDGHSYCRISDDPAYFDDLADYGIKLTRATVRPAPEPTDAPEPAPTDDLAVVVIPAKIVSSLGDQQFTQAAEQYGMSAVKNEDGSFTFTMTPEQQAALQTEQKRTLEESLAGLITQESLNGTIKRVKHNEDFSVIQLYVDKALLKDNATAVGTVIVITGLVACTVPAFSGAYEDPCTMIELYDDATGEFIQSLRAPDDLL